MKSREYANLAKKAYNEFKNIKGTRGKRLDYSQISFLKEAIDAVSRLILYEKTKKHFVRASSTWKFVTIIAKHSPQSAIQRIHINYLSDSEKFLRESSRDTKVETGKFETTILYLEDLYKKLCDIADDLDDIMQDIPEDEIPEDDDDNNGNITVQDDDGEVTVGLKK